RKKKRRSWSGRKERTPRMMRARGKANGSSKGTRMGTVRKRRRWAMTRMSGEIVGESGGARIQRARGGRVPNREQRDRVRVLEPGRRGARGREWGRETQRRTGRLRDQGGKRKG